MRRCAGLLILLPGMWSCAPQSSPESRILDYKQYASIRHEVPYVLEFQVSRGALLMYGGRHVFDPADPQIADIQSEWERFKPTVAYNEGGNPPAARTVRDAVQRYGEPGLVRFLSARDQVPVATFEPDDAGETAHLLKRYSPEQLKVFFALRGFLTFRKTKSERTAEQYMDGDLGDPVWAQRGITSGPHNTLELQEACKRLFPGLEDWHTIPDDWFDPTQEGHYTNEVQNDSGVYRDQHIFKLLVERARRGDRVMAVIGASHVPVQEPALVAALGKPSRKRNGTP